MKRSRGFALASGIFLLVILALLGAFMLNMSNTQHLTSAQDVLGSRAYRAARAGVEWAAVSLNGAAACFASPITLDDGDASAPADLGDFIVTLTCTVNTYQEAGPTGDISRPVFWITSTASNGGVVGSLGYVERSLNAFIEFPI